MNGWVFLGMLGRRPQIEGVLEELPQPPPTCAARRRTARVPPPPSSPVTQIEDVLEELLQQEIVDETDQCALRPAARCRCTPAWPGVVLAALLRVRARAASRRAHRRGHCSPAGLALLPCAAVDPASPAPPSTPVPADVDNLQVGRGGTIVARLCLRCPALPCPAARRRPTQQPTDVAGPGPNPAPPQTVKTSSLQQSLQQLPANLRQLLTRSMVQPAPSHAQLPRVLTAASMGAAAAAGAVAGASVHGASNLPHSPGAVAAAAAATALLAARRSTSASTTPTKAPRLLAASLAGAAGAGGGADGAAAAAAEAAEAAEAGPRGHHARSASELSWLLAQDKPPVPRRTSSSRRQAGWGGPGGTGAGSGAGASRRCAARAPDALPAARTTYPRHPLHRCTPSRHARPCG